MTILFYTAACYATMVCATMWLRRRSWRVLYNGMVLAFLLFVWDVALSP